jgi:hypothetical protein
VRWLARIADSQLLTRVGNLRTLVSLLGFGALLVITAVLAAVELFTKVGWVPLLFFGLALLVLAVLAIKALAERRAPSRVALASVAERVDPVTAAARARADAVPASQRFLHDHAAEMARERDVIRRLHAEYIESHPDVSAALIAGLAPLPAEWVEKRLQEMGETFRWSGPKGYQP